MSDRLKPIYIDLSLGLALIVFVWYLNASQDYTLLRRLSDGCFVAAVILLGSGGLAFCRNKGALDIFGYGMRSLFSMFNHGNKMGKPEEDYYIYCQRKAEKRKPFAHFLIAGAIYLVLASVLTVVYMMTA